MTADDAHQHCKILESFLIERFIPRPKEDILLEQVLTGIRNGARIQDLQKELGLSQRKLHQLFDRRIGVRPKTLCAHFTTVVQPFRVPGQALAGKPCL